MGSRATTGLGFGFCGWGLRAAELKALDDSGLGCKLERLLLRLRH